ncbi:MAG: IS1634 family transposase [Geminicoccaceae bacterium]
MYIETVPNRKSRPAILLREGWREGKKVRKRTLANLTDWPGAKVQALRRLLKGERLVAAQDAFAIERSWPHGHVAALLAMVRRLGLDRLIAAKPCRERDLVLAMILERLIHPASKLATTRLWHSTSLAQELAVEEADVDELYGAMDWLLARQARIEQALARRHLSAGQPVFYDVTSSYDEGRSCPLMRFGHNRDGKKGKTQLVYGVLTGRGGRPVAVEVSPGNTGDPATVADQLDKLKQRFGLARVVLVGDRGLRTETQIERLREHPQLGWIAALRSAAIRQLVAHQHLQLSLFDQQNLAEITAPDFPGERLIACYNPLLAEERARKRAALLAATEKDLAKIARQVQRRTRTPFSAAAIGQMVGRVIARFKVAKHFRLAIADGVFAWRRDQQAIAAEAALDGIYVLRTSEPAARLAAADTVRAYKGLAQVERLFRTLKGLEILVRPIRHRDERRVRAHVFLCLLSAYLEWHLRRALAPLLFDDDTLEPERQTRDPVAPATPTPHAKRKKATRRTEDGLPLHSFDTLLAELATRCRNTCRLKTDPDAPTFTQITTPTEIQRRAQDLIDAFPVENHR